MSDVFAFDAAGDFLFEQAEGEGDDRSVDSAEDGGELKALQVSFFEKGGGEDVLGLF